MGRLADIIGGSDKVMDLSEVTWRKATYSGECVEVATADTLIAVRDSKDPHGPPLTFSTSSCREFLRGAAS